MASIPPPITIRSAASGKSYTVAVRAVSGGFVADVWRSGQVVNKTSVQRTVYAAQVAGKELADTL